VLIIDEAQGLSPYVLEEIRLLSNFESDTAKQLQIILTGQPELRDVLNNPDLRQLKQRVALRCEIKALPNVEETERYITSRLLVAGAERTDIFSPGAVDYIFRCSEGIPRQINNLCDNAMLTGYAAGETTIGRTIIEEVAETFDMLPRGDRGRQTEEREAPARIFTAAGRAELWAAGAEAGSHAGVAGEGASPLAMREEVKRATTPGADEVGAAFRRSGLMGDR
jgi:general secretion pathway protein A